MINNWTIIRINLGNGFFRFDAMAVDEPINVSVGLEFEDGEKVEPGDFSIVETGFSESQVDQFFMMIEQIEENAV